MFTTVVAMGQSITERQALANLQKGKWEKAKGQAMKALRKDSVNASARFVLSTYYFAPGNPYFQIDSAYQHVMLALADYHRSDVRQRERMKRLPLDSAVLITRREEIDSAAFERAKRINTEQAYLLFLERFPFAIQRDRARELRDEVAYIDALKENTYEAYYQFLARYPNASRAQEARDRYEKLLFEAITRDRKLASYTNFINEYPASPYRANAEKQVFEISTASGKPQTFTDFINAYPASRYTHQVRNILYHLLKEEERNIPSFLLTDSIRTLRQLEQGYLVPFLQSGKFGFMNANGKEVIAPFSEELNREYVCGNITEELLAGDTEVVARNGSVVYRGRVHELDDLGYGYLLVDQDSCLFLLHKSGFIVAECVDDARVLAGSLLAIKSQGRWTISTLTGRALPLGEFELVESIDQVLVVRQAGKFRLVHKDEAAQAADQHVPLFSKPFDEVKRWNAQAIWVREGEEQGLLDMNLKEIVGMGRKDFQFTFFGAIIREKEFTRLWSASTGQSESYQAVEIQQPWIAVKQNNAWSLLDHRFKPNSKIPFDSLYFSGPFAVGVKADSINVYVAPHTFIPLSKESAFRFLPGRDSVYFLVVQEKDGLTVFNPSGEKLFSANVDRLEYAGENLFVAIRKEKRGLINLLGKPVVPPEYDAMGNLQAGMVPVLKDRKFGFLDVVNRREIKPGYEKNLMAFNADFLVASKGGFFGLIDWKNKTVLPFEYEEVVYWNDSTALLKKNFQWIIYNFMEKRIVMDKIKRFTWLRDTPHEKLMVIHRENNYGVLSNRKGVILPATYSDIKNLGSSEKPLYFTEKHVEEASIYVVIYYDDHGTLLRRQVFEAEDYERIYCPDN